MTQSSLATRLAATSAAFLRSAAPRARHGEGAILISLSSRIFRSIHGVQSLLRVSWGLAEPSPSGTTAPSCLALRERAVEAYIAAPKYSYYAAIMTHAEILKW